MYSKAFVAVALVDSVLGFNPAPVAPVYRGPQVQSQTGPNGVAAPQAMPGRRSAYLQQPAEAAGSSFLPQTPVYDAALSATLPGRETVPTYVQQGEDAAWWESQQAEQVENTMQAEQVENTMQADGSESFSAGHPWLGGFASGIFASLSGIAASFLTLRALNGRGAQQREGLELGTDMSRRNFAGLASAAVLAVPTLAAADVEYPNVPFLGGSDVVDVNNANIRVYTRFPGMYPTIAGIIVKNGPYESVEQLKQKLEANKNYTPEMKQVFSKYEKNLTALKPAPEYQEDIWNNGLYR